MSRFSVICDFTEDVSRRASGHWDSILSSLVPEIGAALQKPGRHVTCPFHHGKADFRVARDVAIKGSCHCTCGHWDGYGMVQHARGWTFRETVAQVDEVLGGRGPQVRVTTSLPPVRPVETVDEEAIQRKLQKYWGAAMELEAPGAELAKRYLSGRSLTGVEGMQDLRFHPCLPYQDSESGNYTTHPALLAVARMRDGRVATLHRTWLADEGDRVRVVHRKQYTSMPSNPIVGGSIRLYEPRGPALNLAEGIETALSARVLAPDVPVWSCLNKELLRAVHVPAHVRVVTIFADRDASYGGQIAALELVDRLRAEGRRAMMFLPPYPVPDSAKGIDWNDVIREQGQEAARNHFSVRRWRGALADILQDAKQETRQLQHI